MFSNKLLSIGIIICILLLLAISILPKVAVFISGILVGVLFKINRYKLFNWRNKNV